MDRMLADQSILSLALNLNPGPLLAAAMAADIFAMALYLVVVSVVPAPDAQQNALAAAAPGLGATHAPESSDVHACNGNEAVQAHSADQSNVYAGSPPPGELQPLPMPVQDLDGCFRSLPVHVAAALMVSGLAGCMRQTQH